MMPNFWRQCHVLEFFPILSMSLPCLEKFIMSITWPILNISSPNYIACDNTDMMILNSLDQGHFLVLHMMGYLFMPCLIQCHITSRSTGTCDSPSIPSAFSRCKISRHIISPFKQQNVFKRINPKAHSQLVIIQLPSRHINVESTLNQRWASTLK